jgi:hypothetical protein
MNLKKLFIGGHKELKRPVNQVDDGLLQRMEEASRRLRSCGKEVTAVMGPKAAAAATAVAAVPAPQPLRAVHRSQSDDQMVARILDRSVPSNVVEHPLALGEGKSAVELKRASNG